MILKKVYVKSKADLWLSGNPRSRRASSPDLENADSGRDR